MLIVANLPVTERSTYRLDPETAAGLALSYAIIGVALLAVGLMDHRLLVTELRGSPCDPKTCRAPDGAGSVVRMVCASAWLVTTALFVA
jgi:hypothetical protein